MSIRACSLLHLKSLHNEDIEQLPNICGVAGEIINVKREPCLQRAYNPTEKHWCQYLCDIPKQNATTKADIHFKSHSNQRSVFRVKENQYKTG